MSANARRRPQDLPSDRALKQGRHGRGGQPQRAVECDRAKSPKHATNEEARGFHVPLPLVGAGRLRGEGRRVQGSAARSVMPVVSAVVFFHRTFHRQARSVALFLGGSAVAEEVPVGAVDGPGANWLAAPRAQPRPWLLLVCSHSQTRPGTASASQRRVVAKATLKKSFMPDLPPSRSNGGRRWSSMRTVAMPSV